MHPRDEGLTSLAVNQPLLQPHDPAPQVVDVAAELVATAVDRLRLVPERLCRRRLARVQQVYVKIVLIFTTMSTMC